MPKVTKATQCANPSCANEVKNSKYCSTCRSRKYAANNPEGKAYNNLKAHANARGIKFSLTLDGFREGIAGTDYLTAKGRGKNDLTIDRIIEELNEYYDGGIQVLTNSENVKKRARNNKSWGTGQKQDGCPF